MELSKPMSGLWFLLMMVLEWSGVIVVGIWVEEGTSSSVQPSSNASTKVASNRPLALDLAPRPRMAGLSFTASLMAV